MYSYSEFRPICGLEDEPMISLKKFLEQRSSRTEDTDLLQASLQMGRLLLEALATHLVRGRDADRAVFTRTLKGLLRTRKKTRGRSWHGEEKAQDPTLQEPAI